MELRAEVIIDAPAEAAWEVVGERFGQIGEWAKPITSSSLDGDPAVGATRTCVVASFGPFKAGAMTERLSAFDPLSMYLKYESTSGMPAFVQLAENRWSVHPLSDASCVVRTQATLELRGAARVLGPLVSWRLQLEADRVLDDLRHQVEHGMPHPRKCAAA